MTHRSLIRTNLTTKHLSGLLSSINLAETLEPLLSTRRICIVPTDFSLRPFEVCGVRSKEIFVHEPSLTALMLDHDLPLVILRKGSLEHLS